MSSTTSAGGAGGGAGVVAASLRLMAFMPFTIRKIMKARIMKLMATVRKLPQAKTGPSSFALASESWGSAALAAMTFSLRGM